MRLQFFIALRYLFSKKSHNIINIISMICAGGVCIATIALICTLSVYNGFQQLISGVISSFDPDLKIELAEGKNFDPTDVISKIRNIDGVNMFSEVLEETALIRGQEKQTFATIKGVSQNYNQLIDAQSITESGSFILQDSKREYTVLGVALANQIEANLGFTPVSFYAPKYATKVNVANPSGAFNSIDVNVRGIYATHQYDIDSKYAFFPIQHTRTLFNYGNVVSAVEVKTDNGKSNEVQKAIQRALGDRYTIQNKEEQHEDFYKMMRIEKWITFLILFFILLISIINIVGSLSMLILEKKNDIQTLRNLGGTTTFIRQIFLLEGWLISALGAIFGLVIGLILCLLQQHFGIIKLGADADDGTFLVNAYPICVHWTDVALVLFSVLFVGLVVAWWPTRYIKHN